MTYVCAFVCMCELGHLGGGEAALKPCRSTTVTIFTYIIFCYCPGTTSGPLNNN